MDAAIAMEHEKDRVDDIIETNAAVDMSPQRAEKSPRPEKTPPLASRCLSPTALLTSHNFPSSGPDDDYTAVTKTEPTPRRHRSPPSPPLPPPNRLSTAHALPARRPRTNTYPVTPRLRIFRP